MSPSLQTDELSEALAAVRAGTDSRKSFLVYSDRDDQPRELRYGELWERAAALRVLFDRWELAPRGRVLVASADDTALATFVLACLESGRPVVLVDPEATESEAQALLEIAGPALVAADAGCLGRWESSGPRRLPIGSPRSGRLFQRLLGRRRGPAEAEETPSFPGCLAEVPSLEAPDVTGVAEVAEVAPTVEATDDAYVLFTSGSTARPKGVRISRRALAAHLGTLRSQFGYDGGSRLLNVLPLHHADGLVHGVLAAYLSRGQCLRPGRFRLDRTGELFDAVYTFRATHLIVVPTLLSFMDRFGAGFTDALRTGDLRHVVSSAGNLPEVLWRRFEERFGVRVTNLYGLTESVCGGLYCGPDEGTYRRGTIGKPLDMECRVVDGDGRDVPTGTPGELLLRGANLLSGYLGEAAAESPLQDGWYPTGDLVEVDTEGFHRIVGRKKNLVVCGGLNLQPEEVSEVLELVPGVTEAVAFGVPDDSFGEILVACYASASGLPLASSLLVEVCRRQLSEPKVPRHFLHLAELPRGSSGKIDLPAVRERYARGQLTASDSAFGNVRERVLRVAERLFARPAGELTEQACPGVTKGWDSFAHLGFVLELESTFGVRLETADIMGIRSIGDAIRTIESRLVAP